jgi:hypothetical protein
MDRVLYLKEVLKNWEHRKFFLNYIVLSADHLVSKLPGTVQYYYKLKSFIVFHKKICFDTVKCLISPGFCLKNLTFS